MEVRIAASRGMTGRMLSCWMAEAYLLPLVSAGPPFAPMAGVAAPPGAGVPLPSGAGEPAMDERGVVSRSFSRLRRLNGCWRFGVKAVLVSLGPFSATMTTSSFEGGPIDW